VRFSLIYLFARLSLEYEQFKVDSAVGTNGMKKLDGITWENSVSYISR